jgi:hypothetical protein
MKQYIAKGMLILESNTDPIAVLESHKTLFESIVDWANKLGFEVAFGSSADNEYLCEYVIAGVTKAYIKGVAIELKALLKPEFPNIQEHHQFVLSN